MPQPEVSVIIPVYNAMPYLLTCLSSVLEQTIGRDELEVLAVDDGSTDDSVGQLRLLAAGWPGLRVFRQSHSGGPSRPRNLGLARANGRYVFFLDADDYLAPQALQRMVTLADERDLDVVVGRRRGVGGRQDPSPLAPLTARPRHAGLSADTYDSALRRLHGAETLAPVMLAFSDCKHLFRRARISRDGLRFVEGIHRHEDTLFSADYLGAAATVGMIDDYVCYYDRLRDDGNNLTTRLIGSEMQLRALGLALRAQHEHPELRGLRSQLVRSALTELTEQIFHEPFLRHGPGARRRLVAGARELLATWLTPRAQSRMPALGRVKIDLMRRGREAELREVIRAETTGEWGKEIVRAGRVYGAYPYFGDPAAGVPDECYDVTAELPIRHHLTSVALDGTRLRLAGHAYIERVDTVDVTIMFILRERLGQGERRWRARPLRTPQLSAECGQGRYDYGRAGFAVDVDLADVDGGVLPAGRWGGLLAIHAQGVSKEAPIGGSRADAVGTLLRTRLPAAAGESAAPLVSAYFTRFGQLILDVTA